MHRSLLRITIFIVGALTSAVPLLLAVPPASTSADTDESAAQDAIANWIANLDHDLFTVRERAMRNLQKAGPEAMAAVASAAESDNLEVATRAVRVLLELCQSEDPNEALAALQTVAALHNRPVEQRAAAGVLADMREKRALARIESLGGVYDPAGTYVIGRQTFVGQTIHLGEDWRGGDEGLTYLKDMRSLEALRIHGTPVSDAAIEHLKSIESLRQLQLYGTNVSADGVEEMAKAIPGLDTQFRRGALLGVTGNPFHAPGAFITGVQAGSAADEAGLQGGDVVMKYDGQPVQGFDGLTAFIAKRKPGDKAKLEILRNGETLVREVTFGGWK